MDYTKTCWYCKKDTVDKVDGYYKCSECGATWNETPEQASDVVTIEMESYVTPLGLHRRMSHSRPSGRLTRRVKRIREKGV
jgi:tRNA(Ile2) C34 agmatinyltransferase TiaS